MVECFTENGKKFHFLVNSADGYCAEIKVRKKYPNYKLGEVVKLEDLRESFDDFTEDDFRDLGDNY